MAKYPIFLELGQSRVVVIGAGAVAVRKVQPLLDVGARVVVVSEEIDEMMTACCRGMDTELVEAKYSKIYLPGAVLVIAATSDYKTNEQIYKDCQELQILCNIVDDPEHCDFFVPAVVKRGDLQIAIGTEGNCPAYAGHLRRKLEQEFTEKHGQFLTELEKLRKQIIKTIADPADRKALLGKLVDDESFKVFKKNGLESWNDRAQKIISEYLNQA